MKRRLNAFFCIFFVYTGAMYPMEEKSREGALAELLKKINVESFYSNAHAVTSELLIKWIQNISDVAGLNKEQLYAEWSINNYIDVRGTLFKGIRKEYYLKEILACEDILKKQVSTSNYDAKKAKVDQAKESCINCYKIHAMPSSVDEYYIMVERLIIALKKDVQLRHSLSSFKLQPTIDFSRPLNEIQELLEAKSIDGGVMAIIVIYIANGKEHAQYALDALYSLYKDSKGLGIMPRYSMQITDVLSYTMGNGDEKCEFPHCFDEKKVFYSEAFARGQGSFALVNPAF